MSSFYRMTLIHLKRPYFYLKPNLDCMGLRIHPKTIFWFATTLPFFRAAVLPFIPIVSSGTLNTLNHVYSIAVFPFRSRTYFFLSLILLFPYHCYPFFLLSIHTNHGIRFYCRTQSERHASKQSSVASTLCGRYWNDRISYALQQRLASRIAIHEMNHVLEHRSCKENCSWYSTWTLLVYSVLKLMKVWMALTKAANLVPLARLIFFLYLYDLYRKGFIVLSKR